MFMFLPFLVALITIVTAAAGKKKISYVFWWMLITITILTFKHHIYIDFKYIFTGLSN